MESHRGSGGVGSGATSGRACATCSKAKVKCIFDEGNKANCQRCHRLQKICQPVLPRERARRRPNTDRKDRVEKLEAKVEDLVTLIKASQQNGNPISLSRAQSLDQGPSSEGSTGMSTDALRRPKQQQHLPSSVQPMTSSDYFTTPELTDGSTSVPSVGFGFDITGDENPDTLLEIFRNEMVMSLPFILIPSTIKAAEIYEEQPFLYLTIMHVAIRDSVRKADLRELVLQQLGERMYVKNERNMDLLLGVMVFTTWSRMHFYNIPRFTLLITTATSLVGDLRLNQLPFTDSPSSLLTAFRASCGNPLAFTANRTLEERRAYVGYFIVASSISNLFRRIDPPRWTSYIDECRQHLIESGLRSDQCVVALLDFLKMLDSTVKGPWFSNPDPIRDNASSVLHYKGLEKQLWELSNKLPPDIANRGIIKLSNHYVRMCIHRLGLLPRDPNFDVLGCERLEMLHACLQDAKAYFDEYLRIPISEYQGITNTIYTQVVHAMGTVNSLSKFECPGWDASQVMAVVDLQGVISKVADNCGQVKAVLGYDQHTSAGIDEFSLMVPRFQGLRNWVGFQPESEAPVNAAMPIGDQQNADVLSGNGRIYDPAYPSDPSYFETIDNAWLSEIFDWGYQGYHPNF